jgi:hypothetical protein
MEGHGTALEAEVEGAVGRGRETTPVFSLDKMELSMMDEVSVIQQQTIGVHKLFFDALEQHAEVMFAHG